MKLSKILSFFIAVFAIISVSFVFVGCPTATTTTTTTVAGTTTTTGTGTTTTVAPTGTSYTVELANVDLGAWGEPENINMKIVLVKKTDWASFDASATPFYAYPAGLENAYVVAASLTTTDTAAKVNADGGANFPHIKKDAAVAGVNVKKDGTKIVVTLDKAAIVALPTWLEAQNSAEGTVTAADYYIGLMAEPVANDATGKDLWGAKLIMLDAAK